MAEGAAGERRIVMHNDFVIVGPREDPAGIQGGRASDASGSPRTAQQHIHTPYFAQHMHMMRRAGVACTATCHAAPGSCTSGGARPPPVWSRLLRWTRPHPASDGLAIVCASLLPPGSRASKPNALTSRVVPRRRSTVQRAAGLGLSHSSACGCSCPAPIYRSGHVAVWHCQESRDWGGRDRDVARVVAMLTRVADVPFRCCSCLMMRGTPIPFPRGRQTRVSGSLMGSARDAA